jgi:hypothetical protein
MLSAIDLDQYLSRGTICECAGGPKSERCDGEWIRCNAGTRRLDQVIVGGESGAGARACDVEWLRGIVSQCGDAGTPCFVKQLGSASHDRARMRWVNPTWDKSGESKLMLEDRHVASAWPTGCWHTWDFDGIGGWNSESPNLEAAKHDAESAVIGQGYAPVRHRSRSGADPTEWPEDLRMRNLAWRAA